jgi:hypothetical protein
MKATLEFVSQRFAEFNKLCFDSSLPDIPLRISNARTYLGVCRYHKRRKLLGGYEMYGFNICISARFDMPQQEIEDTIIHEMIHYCIWLNGIRDTSAHGREFRRMMESINSTYGRHITISHRGDKQIREQAVDPRPRPHVIALITFTNDRTGVKVLPAIRRNVIRYKRGVMLSGRIRSIEFYATTEPWFNRFPCSSALNVIYKDHQEILPHLEGATHLDI